MADAPFHILMVDDVTRYQMLYEMAITDAMPARVSFATNGEEALEALQSPIRYDLLILDLNMPKLGGEDTLKEIRQDPDFDNMPVIILTGDSDLETHKRLLDIGADDFIEKGAPPEMFVARLKSQLRYKVALDRLARIAVDMDIFAAGVLHDIRNLETNINAVCDITNMTLDEPEKVEKDTMTRDFDLLEQKAQGLAKYAADIIEMVRETQKDIELIPVDVKELFDWVFIIAQSEQEETAFTWEFATELSHFTADQNFLRLAVLNIVQNAIKYCRPEENPKLVIWERQSATSPDTRKVICIRDFGKGVPVGEHRKIFQPFIRGSKEEKDTGFGLGLSLVTKVLAIMNGRVWAEVPEDNGYGTTFCIELPTVGGAHGE